MATGSAASDDAARQIRELDATFLRNAKTGDIKSLVDGFYAEDAQVLPPNTPKVTGKAAILEFWKAVIAAGMSDVHLETTDIAASGDIAYGVGDYSYMMGGRKTEGKYVVVYRRQPDGRYKAIVDAFSPNA
jgi:ketosteroid isomerase-like protein